MTKEVVFDRGTIEHARALVVKRRRKKLMKKQRRREEKRNVERVD